MRLEPFRLHGPEQEPQLLACLRQTKPNNYDVELDVSLRAVPMNAPQSITWTGYSFDADDVHEMDIYGVYLGWLTGRTSATLDDACAAVDALHALGPRVVLVTSLATADTPADAVDLVVSEPAGRFRLRTPRLDDAAHGAGDAIAALFFAHLLRGGSAAGAMAQATSSVFGILRRTAQAGARELLLIEAQDEIVAPSTLFTPEPI